MQKGLLSHIRVLDLSRVLAGPWAGQILADLGADVIKVERPGLGDDTRAWGPPFLKNKDGTDAGAGYFLAANRGKRSITLNLDSAEGQEIVRGLASQSDVLLENYKFGTLDRFGLGYDALSALNPKLVYCSVTGFGLTGPRRAQPAYDFLIQAMGGLMSITGNPDDQPGGGPQKVGIPIVDLVTGVYAATAVLAALTGREVSGRGEHIDLAMLDVQVGLLSNQAMNTMLSGRAPRRTGNAHPNIQPQKVYRCSDGDLVLVVGNDGQFARFCEVIGLPHLAVDERFRTNGARVEHQAVLQPQIDAALLRESRSTWIAKLDAAEVPCGPINSVPEVIADPQVVERRMIRDLPHPTAGSVPQIMSPFRFRSASANSTRAPPTLGQHTEEVLMQLGLSREDVLGLRARAVI